jgi:hypothetical protein
MTHLRALACAGLLLAACSQFPELDETISPETKAAPYPALLPWDSLPVALPEAEEPSPEEVLAARTAALRSRAETLRGAVVDPATRTRMDAGVAPGR